MAAAIKSIVFDLGGVLVDWNPRYLYRKMIDDEARMEWFLAEICNGPWNLEQDRGRSFDEAVEVLLPHYPAEAELIKAYRDRWPEMLAGPIDGTVVVLDELVAGGWPLHAITNWSAETFPVAEARYPFLGHFRSITVSGQVGMVKPNEDIFLHFSEQQDVPPEGAVFIDDNAANIETAGRLGFDAIRFEGPAQLREALQLRGVL
ncbi:MAG: HAD family phosphatase [Pseudomonadota bacterium]